MRMQLLNVPGSARRGLAFILAGALGLLAITALGQPANDNFADAQELAGGWGTVAADNGGATAEPGEPSHAGVLANASVWFKWTAPISGEVSLDTVNSAVQYTVLAVYTGPSVGNLVQVAAGADIYPEWLSMLY